MPLNLPEPPEGFTVFGQPIRTREELSEIILRLQRNGDFKMRDLIMAKLKANSKYSMKKDPWNDSSYHPQKVTEAKIPKPRKPSMKDDESGARDNYEYLKSRGYEPEDIKRRMGQIYRDFNEEMEKRMKNAPPPPFKEGDFVGNAKSSANHQFYRIKKLTYDPYDGWSASVDTIVSKEGINPAISTTTLRKQRRMNGLNHIRLGDVSQRWEKVGEDLVPKLFSRHPHTSIFFVG
jgi:hypothetical protein